MMRANTSFTNSFKTIARPDHERSFSGKSSITSSFEMSKRWCLENREKIKSEAMFGREVKKLLVSKKSSGIYYSI